METQPHTVLDASVDVSKRNVYITENDGKKFISIDMIKGNFSQFRFFYASLIDEPTYEDFIKHFAPDMEHIIKSKYIRQVIFGACNPKKQIQNEKEFMRIFLSKIMAKYPNKNALIKENIFSLGEDEIIFTWNIELQTLLEEFLQRSGYCVYVRCEAYTIHKLANDVGYLKESPSGEKELKCVDCDIYNQVVKYMNKEPITDDDLVVYHNGYLTRYLQPIINPFVTVKVNKLDKERGIIGHIHMDPVPIERLTKVGHTYSKSVIKNQILPLFEKKKTEGSAVFGVLGLPETDGSVVMPKVAFAVTDLYVAQDMLCGDADILDTPCGRTLLNLQDTSPNISFTFGCIGDSTQTSVNEVTKVEDIYFFLY